MILLQRWAVGVWLAGIVASVAVIGRTDFSSDLSAFLPRSPLPAQQVLVEQLREGVVSRLILIGVEGAPTGALAQISKQLAVSLRRQDSFAAVNNGEDAGTGKDREFLWRNRFLLSPAITPEHFSVPALRASLEEDLQLLGSPAGALLQRILPGDPGGELMRLLERLAGQARPASQRGVWFSREGNRALLVAQTRAAGSDIDAQERALRQIRAAFAEAGRGSEARLLLTGPGVFSVDSRERIRSDALRFSVIATALVAVMLLALYRSLRVLGLSLLPVASGALAGVAAVSLGFGSVHGITLGFGVTLIGEGVDYAIYLFTQIVPGTAPQSSFNRIWSTLRLGVLTSICGFSAMLLSGFTGLAQLGLFSIVGLVVAAAVTRWVLPSLIPPGFGVSAVAAVGPAVMALVRRAPRLRRPLLLAVVVAAGFLAVPRGSLWSDDLSSLSPVSRNDQILDQQLRQDIGAPDVRYLVVIHAKDEEAALQGSERVADSLQQAIRQRWLEGFDSPAFYLPSRRVQHARQAALPASEPLRARMRQALEGMPFRANLFEPFFGDVASAARMPLLDRHSLQGTQLELKLDSLLVKRENGWAAMLPLQSVTSAEMIEREISNLPGVEVVLLDLKRESEQLFRTYRREVLTYSLLGAAAIIVLLFVSLRSVRRVFDVLAPLAAAVVVASAVLIWINGTLSIFHLVGLLLVVAVGSNYSLFFDRQALSGQDRQRTIVSLLFASVSTTIAFGLLSFSKVPILNALGSTVGMGAIMALVFSAILSRHQEDRASGRS